jgi:hypothetical protein
MSGQKLHEAVHNGELVGTNPPTNPFHCRLTYKSGKISFKGDTKERDCSSLHNDGSTTITLQR